MSLFVDLDVSVFDPDFTLRPYDYLRELYPRADILGFSSEGMNFLFRFQDCRTVMFSRDCGRATGDIAELEALESRYAALYPARAWYYQHSYSHGDPDVEFKAAVARFINELAERASFEPVQPLFQRLGQGGVLDDYVAAMAKLPMQIFLETCQLEYDQRLLAELHVAGSDFVKSFDSFQAEHLVKDADAGMAVMKDYFEQQIPHLPVDSPMTALIASGRRAGLSDDTIIANVAGNILPAFSNTVGVSSAFILRTLIHAPEAYRQLVTRPELVHDEGVINELLRRDNHVKALSRQVNCDLDLGRFTLPQGSLVYVFFPGINMDPAHWREPTRVDFSRDFKGENNVVFGGSQFTCIGRKLTMAFLKHTLTGFVQYLPPTAKILDEQIEIDGSWVTERIITHMPIALD